MLLEAIADLGAILISLPGKLFSALVRAISGFGKWTFITTPSEIGAEVKAKQDADYISILKQHALYGRGEWKTNAQNELTQMGIDW